MSNSQDYVKCVNPCVSVEECWGNGENLITFAHTVLTLAIE